MKYHSAFISAMKAEHFLMKLLFLLMFLLMFGIILNIHGFSFMLLLACLNTTLLLHSVRRLISQLSEIPNGVKMKHAS